MKEIKSINLKKKKSEPKIHETISEQILKPKLLVVRHLNTSFTALLDKKCVPFLQT